MLLHIILLFLFSTCSSDCFSMEIEKEKSVIHIPIELHCDIESLEINPQISVEENFETILPLQVHSIINRWHHHTNVKKLINKQIKNLIKTSYSKEEYFKIFSY